MKNLIFSLIMLLTVFASHGQYTDATSSVKFKFEYDEYLKGIALRHITPINENDSNLHVVIPGKVMYNGKPTDVVAVGFPFANGFCYSYNKAIKSITFPKEVARICTHAFVGCGGLEEIRFPSDSHLNVISSNAINYCPLHSFTIPPSTKSIGDLGLPGECEELIISDGLHHDITTPISCGTIINTGSNLKKVFLGRNINHEKKYDEILWNQIFDDGTLIPWRNKSFIQTIDVGRNLTKLPPLNDIYLHDYKTISFRCDIPPLLPTYNDSIDLSLFHTYGHVMGDGKFTDKEYERTIINVPCGALASYQSHPIWGKFLHINEVDFTYDKPLTGDVNDDGKVNVSDVAALINQILGIEPMDIGFADISGDERVNVSDVAALINIILGITSEQESLTVSPISANLYLGDTLQMEAHLRGLPKNAQVEWSSTSPKVATVNSYGMLRTSSTGEALIIARVPGRDAGDTCHVTVNYKDDYSIKLDRKQLCLYDTTVVDSCFKNYALDHTITPQLRYYYPQQDTLYVLRMPAFENCEIVWSSSDTTVVSVTPEGVAKKTGEGIAKITASLAYDTAISTSCDVFCFNHIQDYETSKEYSYIPINESEDPVYYYDEDYTPPVHFTPERIMVKEGEVFSVNLEVQSPDASFVCNSNPRIITDWPNTGEISLVHCSPRAWTYKATKKGNVGLSLPDTIDLYRIRMVYIIVY